MSGFFCLSGSPADAAFRSNSVDHFSIPSTSVMHVSTSPNLSPLSLVRESQIDGASDDSAMSELSNISEFISQDTPDSISLHQGKCHSGKVMQTNGSKRKNVSIYFFL